MSDTTLGQQAISKGAHAHVVPSPTSPHVTEILEADPEDNTKYCIAVLVDALAKMKKLPYAVQIIRAHMQAEVFQLVERCIAQVELECVLIYYGLGVKYEV